MSDFPPIPAAELPATATEAEWQAQRNEGLGSSDASIILGLSNWESPYSLWEQKTGRVPLNRPVTPEVERLRRFGHLMEPVTLALTSEELGIPIMKPEVAHHHPEHHWLRCNLDGWTADGRIAEFKNVHQSQASKWDGQVPDHAEIQVHHSGLVLGVSSAIVAGLIGGNRLAVYEITLNPSISEILWEAEVDFWTRVQNDSPPPLDGHERTLESLMDAWPNRPGAVQVEEMEVAEWWEEYFRAHEAEKEAKKKKAEARAHLAALMDGHEALATGEKVWATTRAGRIDEKRLASEEPDIYKQFTMLKPAFDASAFKKAEPEKYAAYQHRTVMPKNYEEE